ncbi:MAG: hypothetical protein NTY90_00020 [Candidatus Micrarchaeota archaeon]|nr:hypothetical protein [Candidatus Micrarchaeota archaeon]
MANKNKARLKAKKPVFHELPPGAHIDHTTVEHALIHLVEPFSNLGMHSVGIAGGKGAQLGEMTKAGIPVPPGFVVLTHAFDLFLAENGLVKKIDDLVAKLDARDTEKVNKMSEAIRKMVAGGKIPEKVAKGIHEEFDRLGAEFVAVRSSATAEDAANASWAGELETYTNVMDAGIVGAVKKCWSSLYTPRALVYRIEKDMRDKRVSVGVVVQKMVQSEVSGVAFTVNPVTNDTTQMIIEAGHGLGESVVAGIITPDNYVVDKKEGLIMDVTVNAQENMIARVGHGSKTVPVPPAMREKQKLPGPKILELAEICKRIERHYGKPQDIEWAVEKGEIYIVQTRPVTTLK